MSAYAGPDTQPSSIHNPFGILGAVRMGLGTVLAVLALLFLRPHIGSVGDMLSGESGVPAVGIALVMTQIAAALAVALWGVVGIILGLRELLGFAVPPDAPGGLRDPADATEQLRQEKLNAYAVAAPGWFRLMLSFFSARAAFLSPAPRKIARQRLHTALWMLLVVVTAAVIGLGPRVMGLHALAVVPSPPGLFFGILLLLIVFDVVLCSLLVPPQSPVVRTARTSQYVEAGLGPHETLAALKAECGRFATTDFTPRVYEFPVVERKGGVADTGTCEGALLCESRARFEGWAYAQPATVATGLGAGLLLLGYGGLLFALDPAKTMVDAGGIAGGIYAWLSFLALICYGHAYVSYSGQLFGLVRYSSVLDAARLDGTFGRVRTGTSGQATHLMADNLRIVGNLNVSVFGALAYTEGLGLDGPREIVSLHRDDRAEDDVRALIMVPLEAKRRGLDIAGPNLQSERLAEVFQAEAQIESAKAQARVRGALAARAEAAATALPPSRPVPEPLPSQPQTPPAGLPEGVDRTVVLPPPDLDAGNGIPDTHLGQHTDESTPEGRIARLQRLHEQGFITEQQLREGIEKAGGQ